MRTWGAKGRYPVYSYISSVYYASGPFTGGILRAIMHMGQYAEGNDSEDLFTTPSGSRPRGCLTIAPQLPPRNISDTHQS